VDAVWQARWLVVGLGNPGPDYRETRHNLGFGVVERLAAQDRARFASEDFQCEVALIRISAVPILLLKPQTFMNRSGVAVSGWLGRLGLVPADLVVVHDDLDLPLGRIRIVARAGPGGHRGVLSIQEQLGTRDFARLRIGIGRPEAGEAAVDRVLGAFADGEAPLVAEVVDRCAAAVRCLILEGVSQSMNRYNGRDVVDVRAAEPREGGQARER
jgi:PTH1 family peptidyl-tRNA hydrolase